MDPAGETAKGGKSSEYLRMEAVNNGNNGMKTAMTTSDARKETVIVIVIVKPREIAKGDEGAGVGTGIGAEIEAEVAEVRAIAGVRDLVRGLTLARKVLH